MENTIVNQNAAEEQPSVLDLLLGEKVVNVAKHLPTAKFEIPRLSEAAGAPVIFTLQALPYGRVQDISRLEQDAELQILLAGCIDPDLKSTPLQHKFGGITPAETLKAMLLPGEIADLSREVERLSGYRRATIEKVKKRLTEGSDPELGLAYYLFHVHGILPGDYYGRPQGEKDLIWALSSYEAAARSRPAPRGKAIKITRGKNKAAQTGG